MSENYPQQIDALPRASDILPASAVFRATAEDFVVDEVIGFTVADEGEHVLLHVRKRGHNTEDIAVRLARLAGVQRRAVSYAGLKDRHAVTTQYFSVHLPGQRDPDWQQLDCMSATASIEVLSARRHQRKLRRGALSANRFRLVLRQFYGNPDSINERLTMLCSSGVPNYFASQRFGHGGRNLNHAEEMLLTGKRIRDRFKRAMYLSAARSWLFNQVLAERVRRADWDSPLPGDAMMLDHSRACFLAETVDAELQQRCTALEVHATGPLWGSGATLTGGEVTRLERDVLQRWQGWQSGLESSGLEMARRRLRVALPDLQWQWLPQDQLELAFSLPPGCYATAVLREVCRLSEGTPASQGQL